MSVQDTAEADVGEQPAVGGAESGIEADRRLLIDGRLVATGNTFPTVNPATGDVLGYAPDAGVEEAEQAIAAARRAFDTTTWSTDVEFRIRCLDQLHQALLDHAEELRELTIAEVGATRALTHGAQLDEPIGIVRFYADLLRTYEFSEDLGEKESRGMRHHRWVEKEAAGVVAAIIAYNYPNQLALAKLPPALAAGCTVVLKGAPDTPLITLALGELIANHTDIPPGVVNVLSSSDPAVGEALTTSPDIDVVTFTGSTAVGRKIMAAASGTVKRVFLELGGKSAVIMLDDADFTGAAMFAAFSMVTHAGQGCALTSRLLVPKKHHDEIVELIAQNFAKVRHGDPADPKTYMGPLINERQRDKVDGMVQRALTAGATLVAGGKRLDPGFFYAPTLLTNVDPDSEIAQDEVFGPVLVVIGFDDDDDAVRIANNSIYGLAGAVFSRDQDRALSVARRIRAGSFSVNGGNYFGADSPFGGFKQSGVGREMGVAGLEEFLEGKTFAVPVMGGKA
ncbi:aldehyde dehydrogenase [Mycobacterium gordonae]|jgi:acyl-CoA reductase-like NAD-dependent aldehyde dehydrogenase|uniref:Aldehyde dehydrogenase n=1 Tax=Mycobacterium gordonae TaxID=1778 RepID=A0A1A6BEU1_MYCGO|nr:MULTISPECIES: aldehyde dehydrogenase family protein [Mycobacterium]OBS00749.1 aldehyde dehydrogenase [Mycobacterium gordonae]